ncbi:MAG: glycosyltransferase family 4 protein [Candidatus Helarchaeota archaeon]
MIHSKKIGVFIAGNFFSHVKGTRAICEELAVRLDKKKWDVITASNKINRIKRMIDFLLTAYSNRHLYQVALIDVHSDLAFIWVEVLCRFLRMLQKPYILNLRGGKLPEFDKKNHSSIVTLLQSASSVLTPSKFLYKNFQSIRPDIQYLPNAIDIKNYPKKVHAPAKPRLIWVRAFSKIYNPTLAIKSLYQVKTQYPDIVLEMIGPDLQDGSYDIAIKTAKKLELMDKITIFGGVPKSQIPKRLSCNDIYINTTNYESFGVAVLEAAACGLCIVTTNVGEIEYLWENNVDALLIPPDNHNAMAEAVMRILSEPDLSERLSINARKKAERFDWGIYMPKIEKIILEVIRVNGR